MSFEWITIFDVQQELPAPNTSLGIKAVDVAVTPGGLLFRQRDRGQTVETYFASANDNVINFAVMTVAQMVDFLSQQTVKTVPVTGSLTVEIGISAAKLAEIKDFLVGD